uniref:Cancer/testis antigen 55-like n=1 Tax=Castor canadensis TaxID=51338 RepID=A0A8B7TU36_CASCN|nr:cancer/testis antigen 55-like [Castor canadensis]
MSSVQDGCALECSQGTERSAVVTDTEHRAGRRRDGSSTRMLTEVEPFSHPFDCNGLSGLRTRLLISCVTAVTSDAVYISNDTYFSMDIVSEGFVPYKGDWIQVEYSTQPGTSNIIAHSLKPTNCSHIDEVYISNMHGSQGVIDDAIFFTLDSLKLPPGYVPQLHDLVDVVIVESAQSCYTWRAVSMTPVQMSQ